MSPVRRSLPAAVAVKAVTGLVLVALVAAVYFVVVIALGRAPTGREETVLALSACAAVLSALLWLPLRGRAERFAQRLLGRAGRRPADLVEAFGTRMTRALPLDEILLQLAESLRKSLSLEAAEVWTGSDGVFERTASDPDRGTARFELTAEEEAVAVRAGVVGPAWASTWVPALTAGREQVAVRIAPAVHGGALLGFLVVERGGEQLAPEEEQTLAELARHVGVLLNTARLDSALQATLEEVRRQADQLRASRARVVAAADAERRRIERDLHDGAQASLVALLVKLRLAEAEPERRAELLADLGRDLERTIEEVRDLAQGIYPPLLAERGLKVALSSIADRAALPVRVEAGEVGRHPPEVEAAVYFCCLEAVQNAGKHAGKGARAIVGLSGDEDTLVFEVSDDGAGFDPRALGRGSGLTNMADRLGAIGGRLRVESAPGAGTRVAGTIPVHAGETRAAPAAERVLATVLFTDVVGSTERAAALGDRRFRQLIDRHHRAVRRELDRFGGREIETAGDGFLAAFDRPAEAVRCAWAIARAVRELGLDVRAGLHTGECEVDGGRMGGIALHVGARVAAQAGPGEVLVSGTVCDLVAGSGIEFEEREPVELKGLPGEWRLYRALDSSAK